MKRLLSFSIFPLLAFSGAATAMQQEWRFRATLDDNPIGYHRFSLKQSSGGRVLTSQANFQVKFLVFDVYKYDHNATEQWAGNCLQGIRSTTNDNGDRQSVDGAAEKDRFVVKSQQGQARLPGCVMTYAYWNPDILTQDRLLNAQTGQYEKVTVQAIGQEPFTVGGKSIPAKRYRLQTNGSEITLWYASEDDHWLGLETVIEGYRLRYELLGPVPIAKGARLSQR